MDVLEVHVSDSSEGHFVVGAILGDDGVVVVLGVGSLAGIDSVGVDHVFTDLSLQFLESLVQELESEGSVVILDLGVDLDGVDFDDGLVIEGDLEQVGV